MTWPNLAKHKALIVIIILGAILRIYGLNWDQGEHLHPDERAIVMTLDKLHWPKDKFEVQLLLTPESSLNPKFFAYGNLPFYLIKTLGNIVGLVDPSFAHYQNINILGRVVSAIFDLGTLVIIYLVARKIVDEKVGLFAAFFYSIAVLPLQLAHFYAVDSFLNFFVWGTLLLLVKFSEHQRLRYLWSAAAFLGFAVACKVSAIILFLPTVFVLVLRLFKSPLKLLAKGSVAALIVGLVFIVCEPYALIDFTEFKRQLVEQQAMTKSAFVFPYTLQFVHIVPYWYEVKNIYLWGLGPIVGGLALTGLALLVWQTAKRPKAAIVTILIFCGVYFGVVGKFAVGFMRYMLPIYPLLCICAAWLTSKLRKPAQVLIVALVLIWPLSFIQIYSQPNSRTTASSWIYSHILPGAKIAREHWEDGLPMGGPDVYQFLELPMYEPDTPEKWQKINAVLAETDYIIIASNRLYTPLMKLTDCSVLPPDRCYPQTAKYYQDLFSGKLGFSKVAEFWTLPTIPFTKIQIDDFSADETFTVYDHPKIMIFKKT